MEIILNILGDFLTPYGTVYRSSAALLAAEGRQERLWQVQARVGRRLVHRYERAFTYEEAVQKALSR